jgi:hypothetical protein
LQRKNARTALIEKIKANEENEKSTGEPTIFKTRHVFLL